MPERVCSIIPPHILRAIAERGDADDRERARVALALSRAPRIERAAIALMAGGRSLPAPAKRRSVFDAGGRRKLPGRLVRKDGGRRVSDEVVNEAWDGAGATWDYFRRVHGRQSIDDRGMRIDSTVHYAKEFNNAQWDGRRMIFGDGDGKYFRRFTCALDVIAHELTHGVNQYTAVLGYTGQAGALAEHVSDVFGVLVRQYRLRQRAEDADWLVGAGLFTDRVRGVAIRSLKAPGTAYDDPVLGRDPQPSHMRDYVRTRSDDGGVHINSGIPNYAFYRLAMALGGHAWEIAGRIWYHALVNELGPRSRFRDCAAATHRAAGLLYGGDVQESVAEAWAAAGLRVRRSFWQVPDAAAWMPELV
jgi:Zn-dependent metalloprotease